jgi:8-oxo-dGTP pyrophosphatase MutT (NUDIX family)
MIYEKSCGAVVFTKIDGEIKYLLISNLQGIYGFPKGHIEGQETEEETALREVYEETNLRIELIDGFRTTDEHFIPQKKDTVKQITYFLGVFENQNVLYQREELSGACLVSYAEAMELFQFESSRRILTEANEYLKNKISDRSGR